MRNGVIAIIFNPDKSKVLLIERCDVPVWVLPGGGIDPGETPEEAVCREAWEETGMRVEIIRQVGEYTPLNKLSSLTYVFECKPLDGLMRTGCETKAIGFYPLQQLPKVFFIVHRDWLQDALRNKEEVIKRPNSRVTYFELVKFFFKHPILVIRFFLYFPYKNQKNHRLFFPTENQ